MGRWSRPPTEPDVEQPLWWNLLALFGGVLVLLVGVIELADGGVAYLGGVVVGALMIVTGIRGLNRWAR